jgi:hypothetical protein
VQAGDNLGGVEGVGRRATTYSPAAANVFFIASENWTDSANGAHLVLQSTPPGSTAAASVGVLRADTGCQFQGTQTNDNAIAGWVGEYLSQVITTGVSLTNATTANIASITVTAGDWDVWGELWVNPAGSTVVQLVQGGIGATSLSIPANPVDGSARVQIRPDNTTGAGNQEILALAPCRVSLTTSTVFYLTSLIFFTTSTCTASGKICARRRR